MVLKDRQHHAETKGDTCHLKKVMPNVASEQRILVTADNRQQKPMKADDTFEEGTGDRGSDVGVAEHNEVGILGAAIDHH